MARPRTIDDRQLLEAAERVLAEVGTARFTLALAAKQAGVAAATMVHRFGSKQGLFAAINQRWLDRIDAELSQVCRSAADPLERLRRLALWGVADLDDPGATGRQLSSLARDLEDELLRGQLAEGFARIEAALTAAVDAARSELPSAPPPAQAAGLLLALVEGTKIRWSIAPAGSLGDLAAARVDELLGLWAAALADPPDRGSAQR